MMQPHFQTPNFYCDSNWNEIWPAKGQQTHTYIYAETKNNKFSTKKHSNWENGQKDLPAVNQPEEGHCKNLQNLDQILGSTDESMESQIA